LLVIEDLGKSLVRWKCSFPSKNQIYRYLAWCQLRDTLESAKVNCVLDVGANKGQFAISLRKIGFRGWIISFEPSPDDFAVMSRIMKDDPRWRGHQIALGGENTVSNFNVTLGDTRLSSFLSLRRSDDPVKVVAVELKRLDSIYDELLAGIESPVVFLKMDTQGFDLEVIKGAEGCLGRVEGLLSEIAVEPNYEKMPSYLESLKIYQDLGFRLMGVSEIAWDPVRGSVVEMECLMAR
jgi:FkbM family methyltransferase